MRKRFNCALGWALLLLCPMVTLADEVSQSVLLGVAETKIKVARFEEKRVAFYLDQPLISRGTLRYQYPDSLEKITLWPEQMRQSLTAGKLHYSHQGADDKSFDVATHAGLSLLFRTILGILSGNEKVLSADYAIEGKKTAEEWTLTLHPTTEEARKWFKRVEVSGSGAQINQLKVTESNGDYTSTHFYEHSQH